MDHLAELGDWPTRNAIDAVQSQYELMILDLLDRDPGKALAYLEAARERSLHYIKNLGGDEFTAMENEAKSGRIAITILENSFARLIATIRDEAQQKRPPAGEVE